MSSSSAERQTRCTTAAPPQTKWIASRSGHTGHLVHRVQGPKPPSVVSPARRSCLWSGTTPGASICPSCNSGELPETLSVACVIRWLLRPWRLQAHWRPPIVKYGPSLAASTPRESLRSVVEPGQICLQIRPAKSVGRHSGLPCRGLRPTERRSIPLTRMGRRTRDRANRANPA